VVSHPSLEKSEGWGTRSFVVIQRVGHPPAGIELCFSHPSLEKSEGWGESNCPLCAGGNNANKSRIYKFDEMDADHVTAWSKGGGSSADNCEMLCITHNRAKGNR
jgi:5-methylcytosine-specific restriction endonuclease McrA